MKKVFVVFSLALILAGCKKDGMDCQYTTGDTVAPADEKTMVTAYLSSHNINNAVQLGTSGMYYVIDVPGSSGKANQCSYVAVKYVGEYENGVVFDQSTGSNSVGFTLGQLIEGWRRGLLLIGAGGKIKLYVPPTLGYGPAGVFNSSTGAYVIKPNALLIFDVELVSIN